jgi:hypothetical protein
MIRDRAPICSLKVSDLILKQGPSLLQLARTRRAGINCREGTLVITLFKSAHALTH